MINRRSFIKSGSLAITATSISLGSISCQETTKKAPVSHEWRNKQSDMAYRQLGNTGFMVSEFVNGGDPVSTKSFKLALS